MPDISSSRQSSLRLDRRAFQFGIGTTLLVIAVLCVLLAEMRRRAELQRVAVAAIRANGGTIYYEQGPYSNERAMWVRLLPRDWSCDVIGVRLYAGTPADETTRALAKLPNLKWVYLGGTNITDEGLRNVRELRHVRSLFLHDTAVTSQGLEHLSEWKELEELNLIRTQVDDSGLRHLEGMDRLSELWLSETKVSDAGLPQLKSLRRLQGVALSGSRSSESGITDLHESLRLSQHLR